MKRNVVAWAALVVSTAALVSSRGITRQVPAAPGIPAESQRTAQALSDAFVAVADFSRPSVVQISVERSRTSGNNNNANPFQFPNGPRGNIPQDEMQELLKKFFRMPGFGPEREQFGGGGVGTGSGFVYDDRGHILTNNHVVDHAGKITVKFHDGTEAVASVVGRDPGSDVAVIKVDNTSYRPLPKGASSKLRVGDLVMAVGSPFGLSQSVTMGIVSATERNDLGINGEKPSDTYESFIQTDAPINPGNSGGPLVDMEGRVIGINSAIMSGGRMMGAGGGNDGVGFAIPIDLAASVADRLIKDGKINRARMGVQIQQLQPDMARNLGIDPKTKGALVAMVLPGSPADKAGLQMGDVITEFNGTPVTNASSFRLSVAASEIGKPATLKYFREGREQSTEVVLGSSDKVVFDLDREQQGSKEPENQASPEKASLTGFGLEVQSLTPELAKGLGFVKTTKGLLISSVKEDGPADAAGLKPGMVITKVMHNRKPEVVDDLKTFQEIGAKSNDMMIYVQANDGLGTFVNLSKSKTK